MAKGKVNPDQLTADFAKALSDLISDMELFNKVQSKTANDLSQKWQQALKDINQQGIDVDDFATSLANRLQKAMQSAGTNISAKALAKEFQSVTSAGDDVVNKLASITSMYYSYSMALRDYATELASSIMVPLNSVISKVEKLPFGRAISSALDLRGISAKIESNLINSLVNAKKDGVSGFKAVGKAGVGAVKDISVALWNMVKSNPILLAIAAVIALVSLATKKWFEWYEATKTLRDETGLVADQVMEIGFMARDLVVDYREFGVTIEEISKSAAAIVNDFGTMKIVSQDMIKNVSLMAGSLKVGVEDATKLQRTYMYLGDLTEEQTLQLAAATANLAKMSGVAPSRVFKDMSESSEEIYMHFRGNVIQASLATVELNKMGLSLKKAADVAKGLLDFESSISAELEASVLTGRNLNFQRARYLAFEGDILGATKEVLNQVKQIGDFDKLNYFQKEAIAKASGMTVEELTKAVKQEEKLKDLTFAQKKEIEEAAEQVKKLNEVNAEKMLQENTTLLATEKLGAMWDRIAWILSSLIMPVLDAIFPIVDEISKVLDEAFRSEDMKKFADVLEWVGKIVGGVLIAAFKTVFDIVMSIVNVIWDLGDLIYKLFTGDFSGAMESMKNLIGSTIELILDWIFRIPKLLFGVIDEWFGTKLYDSFNNAIDGIKNIFTSMWDWIKNLFQELMDWVADLWRDIVPDWVLDIAGLGGSGNVNVTTNAVPPTAEGGLVEKAQIRQVGEAGPEAIIPLDRMAEVVPSISDTSDLEEINRILLDNNKSSNEKILNKLDKLIKTIQEKDDEVVVRKYTELLADILRDGFSLNVDSKELARMVSKGVGHPATG